MNDKYSFHMLLFSNFSMRASLILPDVFIVTDFRLFHSGVTVHFVDDDSKSQKVDLR